jgi:hypothetical protein
MIGQSTISIKIMRDNSSLFTLQDQNTTEKSGGFINHSFVVVGYFSLYLKAESFIDYL